MGLAAELASLNIPQTIVMREDIPDRIAQEFLKYFLEAFASGQPSYLAVREARERLQGLEGEYPCASWLPVIFQNPACQLLNWEPRRYVPNFKMVMAASLAVAVLVLGVRHLGILQPLELMAYDRMMQLRPEEKPDLHILVIEVTQEDIKAQDPKERGWFSLSNDKLIQVIKKINQHQPSVIGLDMYRDESPLSDIKPSTDLAKLFKENENHLFSACKVRESNTDLTDPAPASFIPAESLGFSDVVYELDSYSGKRHQLIRRHLLYMNPDSKSHCQADYSINLLLAQHILYKQYNIQINKKSDTVFDLGKARFQKFPDRAGGYQSSDSRGFQILLNYRKSENYRDKPKDFVSHTTVSELLKPNSVLPDRIKDKIILIGVTDPAVPDDFQTPYGTPIRGVFLHAQMISQINSASATGERPLLGVWAWWADGLWICGWSVVGGLIVWRFWGAIPIVGQQ